MSLKKKKKLASSYRTDKLLCFWLGHQSALCLGLSIRGNSIEWCRGCMGLLRGSLGVILAMGFRPRRHSRDFLAWLPHQYIRNIRYTSRAGVTGIPYSCPVSPILCPLSWSAICWFGQRPWAILLTALIGENLLLCWFLQGFRKIKPVPLHPQSGVPNSHLLQGEKGLTLILGVVTSSKCKLLRAGVLAKVASVPSCWPHDLDIVGAQEMLVREGWSPPS